MANSFTVRKSRRGKKTCFNPTREFVDSAVQEFLDRGGHITKVEKIDKNYRGFLAIRDLVSPADEFLLGN